MPCCHYRTRNCVGQLPGYRGIYSLFFLLFNFREEMSKEKMRKNLRGRKLVLEHGDKREFRLDHYGPTSYLTVQTPRQLPFTHDSSAIAPCPTHMHTVRVRLPLIINTGRVVLMDTCHMLTGSVGTTSSRVALASATMPWPPTATLTVPLARLPSHFLFLPSSTSPHHVRHDSASLSKGRQWVCSRVTRCCIRITTV